MSSSTSDAVKKSKVIFVVGGPGSGKGTQCDLITRDYGFTLLNAGDLLRTEIASGSHLGMDLTHSMEHQWLVSSDTMLLLLKKKMEEEVGSANGFLIDGYPRDMEQAYKFENEICPCTCVLYFNTSDATMTYRSLKRAENTGNVDDTRETIQRRLKHFHDATKPVIEYFRKDGRLCEIAAEGTVDEIYAQVKARMDSI